MRDSMLVFTVIRHIWEYTESIMALDWSQCAEITRSPDVMSGEWVFRNTRLPVATVFDEIEGGISIDEIPEIYPGVELGQVKAVVHFASESLRTVAQVA